MRSDESRERATQGGGAMTAVSAAGRVWRTFVCACTVLALSAGAAQATAEPHPHVGKLPGYPVMRGVVPVLGSQAAESAHEKLVKGAFATRARRASGLTGSTEPNERFISECEEEAFFASGRVLPRWPGAT